MSDKSRCPCGGVILADTEDWETPLCYSCYSDLLEINRTANEKISDLEARLTEATRKVEELDKSIDLRWQPTVRNLREENARLKALLNDVFASLTSGGYNSTRETVALMAEGEGNDVEIYRTMAKRALISIDAAIAKLQEVTK